MKHLSDAELGSQLFNLRKNSVNFNHWWCEMFKLLEKILIPFVTILIISSANAAYSGSKEFVLHVEGIVGTQCNTWASRYFGTQKAMVTELLIKVDEVGVISGTSKIISGNTFIRDNLDPKYNKKKVTSGLEVMFGQFLEQ